MNNYLILFLILRCVRSWNVVDNTHDECREGQDRRNLSDMVPTERGFHECEHTEIDVIGERRSTGHSIRTTTIIQRSTVDKTWTGRPRKIPGHGRYSELKKTTNDGEKRRRASVT